MAIPSSGTIQMHGDVANEFAPNTRPDPFSLNDALDMIFGSGHTKNSPRDFAGLSRPTNVDTQSASNVDADSATLNGSSAIGDGGLSSGAFYYFMYDDNSGFTSPSYTSQTLFNGSTNPAKNISGLNAETTYYFKLMCYNGFNGDNGSLGSSDHTSGGVLSFETASACPQPTNPTDALVFGGGIQVSWSSSINPANGFEIQYNVFGVWNALTTVSGTARQYTHNGCGTDYPSGQQVYHRVRAKCSGGDSSWSQTNAVTPSC